MEQKTKSSTKYYKNSTTGYIVCEKKFESDIINNIPNLYLDMHMRVIGRNFDLTGYLEIKQKKYDMYRWGRWDAGEINSWYKKEKSITEIRKEKLNSISKNIKK